MKLYCLDAEWDGDKESVIHCIVVKEYPKGQDKTFTDLNEFKKWRKDTIVDRFIIHNGLTSDVPVINKVAGEVILEPGKVIDTFVVSRLVDYNKFNTHSLKELGQHLGVYKGDYTGDWGVCTKEMIEYCEQDVEVLKAITKMLWLHIVDPKLAEAMRLEHEVATICDDMQRNGFLFDKDKAEDLLEEVKDEMETLENRFKKNFPSKLVEVKRLKMRYTKDGVPYATVLRAMSDYPKTEVDGDELVVYDYKEFNPGSSKDRIDVLWDAGWEPVEKTKGYIKELRKQWR